jgi:hypothetical protein
MNAGSLVAMEKLSHAQASQKYYRYLIDWLANKEGFG